MDAAERGDPSIYVHGRLTKPVKNIQKMVGLVCKRRDSPLWIDVYYPKILLAKISLAIREGNTVDACNTHSNPV